MDGRLTIYWSRGSRPSMLDSCPEPGHNAAMQQRVGIALAVLLVAVAGLVAWQAPHDREPVYQGKRLSSWLRDATNALRKIDPEAAARACIKPQE
jgi:hypothetical protein